MDQPEHRTEKSVLVTGASTGIGLACALRFDALGFRVFAGYRRQEDAQSLSKAGSGRLIPVQIEVTDPTSICNAEQVVSQTNGGAGLYGLVNNAGIAVASPVEFIPLEDLREQFEVNVIGQVAVTQVFLPHLRQAKGRIINISSFSGLVSLPFFGPYASSKFALEALSDALRVELRPWGICVSVVEPGRIATPIWGKSLRKADERLNRLPAAAQKLYGPTMAKVRNTTISEKKPLMPVEMAVAAIEHALTAKRPKSRYIVGKGIGRTVALFRIVPTWLRDWLVARRMGIEEG